MSKQFTLQGFNKLAQNTLKQFDSKLVDSEPCPIPIDEIMEFQYGLNIRYESLSKTDTIHGITVFDDCLVPIYDFRAKSYVNVAAKAGDIFIERKLLAKNRGNRLRFTLAHELAHWIIHQEEYGNQDDLACKTSSKSVDKMEREADYLAAALLMPEGRLRVAWKRTQGLVHEAKIPQLASMFQVSSQAMALRLSDLNLSGRRYENVTADGQQARHRKTHALRCPHCSSPLGNISASSKPFGAESTGMDLNLFCHHCKHEVCITLENT